MRALNRQFVLFCTLAAPALLVPAVASGAETSGPEKAKSPQQIEFDKLVARVEEANQKAKTKGPLAGSDCVDLAKDFESFGKHNHAAEGYFNGGDLRQQCGDLAGAEKDYREALTVNPQFAPAMVNLGDLAYRRGDLDGAKMEYDAANKADPKNVQAYNGQGLILVKKAQASGDNSMLDQAVGRFRRALALDADSMPAYAMLAQIYYTIAKDDSSKLDLAELVCKQAKEVNDKYPQIYNTLGLIKLRQKDVTGALQEFKAAAELDPHYVEAQLNIGAITLSARDYTTAEKAFKAALDARPTDPKQLFDATVGLGVAMRGQRRYDEAEKWYVQAKKLDPRACSVSYNLGVLYQDYEIKQDNSNLNQAKNLLNEFLACGVAPRAKLADAKRRIKDIDDTFKAIAEAKEMEAEQKKMEEQMRQQQEQMKKQQEQQEQQLQQQKKAAPAAAATPAKKTK